MSLLNDASLILVPSAIKTGEVLVQKPLPNKFADETGNYDGNDPQGSANLTFTRASNATRVGPDGLIEKVRTNLNTYSSDFGNGAYYTINATRTTGQSDPFGTSTATRFLETTATDRHGVYFIFYNPPSTGEVTQSIYVKDNGRGAVNFSMASRNIGFVFTFATETISNVIGSALAYSATSVGNGWYRLSLTFPVIAGSPINHTFVDGYNGSTAIYAGDVTKGFIIAAAQLEYNVGASPYIPTNGAAVSVGPVANVPRLDYLNSSCPRLLLEPQRTNLLQYSEQFNNAYWEVGSAASVSANTSETLDPAGYYGADKLTANGTGRIYVRYNVYLGTTQTCSSSIFAKKANHRYVGLRNSGTVSAHDVFDFDTKTWTNNSGATLSYDELGNGWFRLKSTNTDAVNLNYYWSVIPAVNTSGFENTTASNLSVYIWGGQAEQNAAYATSYIPTLGAAVTRTADACSKTGISSLIGQTEGTLFVEVDTAVLGDVFSGNSRRLFTISDGTTTNRINIFQSFSNDSIALSVTNAGVGQASISSSANQSGIKKIAVGYANNDFVMYVNGVQIGTDTSGSVPACSRVGVGSFETSANSSNAACPVSQALLFKTRLSNADLAALTTI